jgi:hypothetical protein
MPSENDFWYRLGFALERARQGPGSGSPKLATLDERRPAARGGRRLPSPAEWPAADQLLTSGAVAAAAKLLDLWRPRHKVRMKGLMKGGLAGAAAALAVELVRPLLEGRAELPTLDEGTVERLVAGAGQGLLYGAVVEPRLPGPSVVKGTVYASAEFAVQPVGGLSGLLGSKAPLRRVPAVGAVLDGLAPRDRSYVEHLAFGIALALIYGEGESSSGTRDETA